MNAVGRQAQRSSAGGGGGSRHHRQSSDHFLDSFSTSKWHQQMDVARMLRSSHRSGELFADPSTPPVWSRSSSLRKAEEENASMGELSSGLLDLHSFDTELLPDMPVVGMYERNSFYSSYRGTSVDDSEASFSSTKQMNKTRGIQESNFLKSLPTDKEKSAAVAKIKVVVRKRPINKKEISKKDEDIITIEPHSNSLTVHETKIKVDLTEYVEKHEFTFDAVLDQNVSNDEVYHETVAPIVPSIFQRTKATCFAYGQTGQ